MTTLERDISTYMSLGGLLISFMQPVLPSVPSVSSVAWR
jgi:hypothetical protein